MGDENTNSGVAVHRRWSYLNLVKTPLQARQVCRPSSPQKGNYCIPSTSSGSPKGFVLPSKPSGSPKGFIEGEPPFKRPRSANQSDVTDVYQENDNDYMPYDADNDDESILESSAQHWQASEELSTLLNTCFTKQLSGYNHARLLNSKS
ncbi:hypothetical protein AC249_AIPGENE5018 [Exaiptasia diaphana]|nr:hypothetical protein AC249_AIPGENE5018 [Exaiptasia diaphana]